MEDRHQPVSRGVSWTGPGATTPGVPSSAGGGRLGDEADSREGSVESDYHNRVKGKTALTSSTTQLGRKTNLSRSASLSEKELKEARTRSQIIAAQLTVPSNSNSRGVQLFNRRKQRVNAFTRVSFGERADEGVSKNEQDSSPQNALTWERKHITEGKDRDLNHKNSETKLPWSSGEIDSTGSDIMEDQGEPIHKAEAVADSTQERHFLPVSEKDEDLPEELVDEVKGEITLKDDNSAAVLASVAQREVELNGAHTDPVNAPGEIPNGCHSTQSSGKVAVSLAKQPAAIINRTARPFFSPTPRRSAEAMSPVMDIPPAPSYSTPPLPAFPGPPLPAFADPRLPSYSGQPHPRYSEPQRPAFSPPPPPPSYPTPPLPTFTSPPPPALANPPPRPLVMPPSPAAPLYNPPSAPRPTYVPQLLSESRPQTPIRTGILDEGKVRRGTRKSMFTFQEKPKIAPNPELLSLVQGADEKKKLKANPEAVPEEELLALGAEASNFLAKDEARSEEATVPEWSSCLKSSSRSQTRTERKPEQALTNESGKGAALFAKRQSRMEKYVLENAPVGQIRSPSPTMSLPPSWVYPSNMPGRVKAMANSSNISTEISRTLKAQQPTRKKKVPAAVPPPVPESPPLENGCTKIEMELSRHQPYQLNSSLFILNPTRDPMTTLPRGAPPPKPVVTGQAYSRKTSLPTSPSSQFSSQAGYRSAHCFSPPMMPFSPVSGVTSPVSVFSPERVASPRSAIQAPRPTFSAKKAGIEPQVRKESPAAPVSTRTPNLTRKFSSPEGPPSRVWSPSPSANTTQVSSPRTLHKPVATSPVSPPWETRCQSPIVTQDVKANHRLLAKNIINAAKRKNSPSPRALSGHGLPISPAGGGHLPYEHKPMSPFLPRSLGGQSPTFTSPPPTPTQMIGSPVRLYNTRSLTDSDASVESEDSGLRSPGIRTYNACPRGWSGSLRIKRGNVHADL